MAAIPIEKDALDGPVPIEILARVAAQMGEPDRAIAALQKLLSIPYEAHWLGPCRSLLRCSGSIRCSIRSGMIRASKNSLLRKHQNSPADFSNNSGHRKTALILCESRNFTKLLKRFRSPLPALIKPAKGLSQDMAVALDNPKV